MVDKKGCSDHYVFFGQHSSMNDSEYCLLIEQLVLYYDRRGRYYKVLYLSLSVIRIVLVSLVPILALSTSRFFNPYMLTLMSSATLIADGIVNITSCRDKWKTYRRTCDMLCMEHRRYSVKSGIYDDKSGLTVFANRCEAIINSEGKQWEMYIDSLGTREKKHNC